MMHLSITGYLCLAVSILQTKLVLVIFSFIMFQVLPTLFETKGLDITKVIASQEGSLEDIVTALNYISSLDGTDRQVDIVNMSFGNECTMPSLNEKLYELAKNKVLIAAAGKRTGIFQLFHLNK